MDNFMDKFYSKLVSGSGQKISENVEQRRKVMSESKLEAISSLIKENDSKQLECIVSLMDQEGEERELAKELILQQIASLNGPIQNIEVNLNQSVKSIDSNMQGIASAVQGMELRLNDIDVILEQMRTEESFEPEEAQEAIGETQLTDLEDHIHKENVKCYRNVQACVMEQSALQMEQTRNSSKPLKGMMIAILLLNIANLAAIVLHLLKIF
ncbi:MAG: hypothetical protein GX567_13990 [Clostridia bacterium]|nr:hypothetical protein [Clostridia bacterium]